MSDLVLYNGAYTGPQVDQAISRALTGGELDKEIEALKAAVGSPLLANTAADMTNINKIYVYVGSEPGYTNGDWYYWDGAAWVSGGQYLSPGYTFDDEPTEGSDNPVKSGGIFDAIEAALDEATTTALAAFPTDTASGSIVSFPDGADGIPVKSMTVDIEPQQDLHGYDAPWPAGGGKNKFNFNITSVKNLNQGGTWSGNVYSYQGITYTFHSHDGISLDSVTFSGTATNNPQIYLGRISLLAGNYNSVSSLAMAGTEFYIAGVSASNTRGAAYVPFTLESAISNSYVFLFLGNGTYNNAVIKPMICLQSATDPTTFAPYSNICPISGWTGAEIERTGANVWDEEWELGGYRTDNGEFYTYTDRICSKNAIAVVPNSTVYGVSPGNAISAFFYDASGAFISYANAYNRAFSVPPNAYTMQLTIYGTTSYNHDVSINYPATVTTYEPYSGTTYTVTWTDEGTVYGGTATYIGGGKWRVTPTMARVDMGTLDYAYHASTSQTDTNRFSAAMPSSILSPKVVPYGTAPNAICLAYAVAPVGSLITGGPSRTGDFTFYFDIAGAYVIVLDTAYTDAAAFKTAMSGVQLVYELATPLTPIIIDGPDPVTLYGNNNVWADCGDVTVQYRADVGLYIQKLIGG